MEMETGKLFIGGISWDTSEERLKEYFETFGEVVEAVIMKDRTTGRARGFGFVVFANASVAEQVVRERHVIDGRTVEAKKAVPRDDYQNFNRNNISVIGSPSIMGSPNPTPTRSKKIFVGGLASTVTETDFKTYFDQFGTITDVVVMYDHNTQRPRGFGFITFDSEEAVDKVLFKTFHELNGKMVEVKRAVPKELSPGPIKNPLGGYNYSLNRVASLLNTYSPGYNSSPGNRYGQRMDDRFSPVSRTGYPPYSPYNYNMGLNLDSGFNLNYGPSGNSGLGYENGPSSYYSNPIGTGPLLSTTNRNVWGNSVTSSNAFVGSGNGNTGIRNFGNIGEIWDGARASAQNGGNGSLNIGRGDMENNFGGRPCYVRNYGGTGSLYSVTNDVNEGSFGNLNGGESFYGNHGWRSSSPEFEGSASFGYGHGAATDAAANNSVGYVGGYSVTGRSNRGTAA